MIPTEKIVEDLQRVSLNLNRIPTVPDYISLGKYGINTVKRRFGKWTNALKAVFNQTRHNTPETPKDVQCDFCFKKFIKRTSQIRKTKRNYCSLSCSAKFNNQSKRNSRRSKCEINMFELISKEFPQLKIIGNDKTMLDGLEIDIAIPSLKLGIEWNGIVHFKPIYGEIKLQKIQSIDKRKLDIANKNNINLIVIPDLVSNKDIVQKAFEQIKNIINDLINLSKN